MTQPWYLKDYKKLMKTKGRVIPLAQKTLMMEYREKNQHRDTNYLHPSELSKRHFCTRSAWYKIKKYQEAQENYSFSRLNVFEEGNNIHRKWQNWLHNAGVLWGVWACDECDNMWNAKSPTECILCSSKRIRYREVPLRDDEHHIIGHADGEIEDEKGRALIEIKSVGVGTVRWEKPSLYEAYANNELTIDGLWDSIKTPFPSHLRQGNLYMHCRKIDTIIFIYEWKPTQQVKEFEVRYQPEQITEVLNNCKIVMSHLESDTVPERPEWATNDKCNGCRFCPYKEVCWNGKSTPQE
jgi:rubrerythrin